MIEIHPWRDRGKNLPIGQAGLRMEGELMPSRWKRRVACKRGDYLRSLEPWRALTGSCMGVGGFVVQEGRHLRVESWPAGPAALDPPRGDSEARASWPRAAVGVSEFPPGKDLLKKKKSSIGSSSQPKKNVKMPPP